MLVAVSYNDMASSLMLLHAYDLLDKPPCTFGELLMGYFCFKWDVLLLWRKLFLFCASCMPGGSFRMWTADDYSSASGVL